MFLPKADRDNSGRVPGDTVEIGVVGKPSYLFETHAINRLWAKSIKNLFNLLYKNLFLTVFQSSVYRSIMTDRLPLDSTL